MCIQETHLKDTQRFFIRGYESFRQDRPIKVKGLLLKKVKLTFVKTSIPAAEVKRSGEGELEHITVKLLLPGGEITITNCYSPPATKIELCKLKIEESSHLIVGDFNGHSPSWGYEDMDQRGEEIEDWMMENKLILINQPDDTPTFYSRAWKKTSSPDLAMATDDIDRHITRTVESQLGGSDHVPVILQISNTGSTTQHSKSPSWNFKKANWTLFSEQTDQLCQNITLTNNINHNISQLNKVILQSAQKAIPRGRRREYKPYWSETRKIA